MTKFKSDFLNELEWRGFIAQMTHEKELDEAMYSGAISAYIGFDCTASSLHVGSLIQIMILRLLQKHGHKPLVLLGGGTTKIGDPSGKDKSRQILGEGEIENNLQGIRKVLAKFINFEGEIWAHSSKIDGQENLSATPNILHQRQEDFSCAAQIVNNDDWLKDLNYIEFLRDIGKHFSVNRMLSFESVKARLDRDQPLSFLEFNYMILQAYDFYILHRDRNCVLQIGGSDQWGNIVNGVELIRKKTYEKFKDECSSRVFYKELLSKYNESDDVKAYLYLMGEAFFGAPSDIFDGYHEGFRDSASKNIKNAKQYLANIESQEASENILRDCDEFIELLRQNQGELEFLMKNQNSFGLTSPLLTTADGKKMGKTADGAIWLDEKLFSAFDYFQYFRNVDDGDVARFLKLFTDLDRQEIAKLEKLKGQEINKAKEILAFEVTKICHGESAANDALQKAREIFVAKNSQAFIEKKIAFDGEKKLVEIMKEIGACKSNSEARRLIEGNGVKIDGKNVDDANLVFAKKCEFNLQIGKKKFFKVGVV